MNAAFLEITVLVILLALLVSWGLILRIRNFFASFVLAAKQTTERTAKEAARFKKIFGVEIPLHPSKKDIAELQPCVRFRLMEFRIAWFRSRNSRGPEFERFREARKIAKDFGFNVRMVPRDGGRTN